MNREEKIAFLRGFFEGDGSLHLQKGEARDGSYQYRRFRVVLYNTDPFLIKTIKKILIDLGFVEKRDFMVYYKKSPPSYRIVILQPAKDRFLTLIRRPMLETAKGQQIEFYHANKDKTGKELKEIYEKQWKPRGNKEYKQKMAKKLSKSLKSKTG